MESLGDCDVVHCGKCQALMQIDIWRYLAIKCNLPNQYCKKSLLIFVDSSPFTTFSWRVATHCCNTSYSSAVAASCGSSASLTCTELTQSTGGRSKLVFLAGCQLRIGDTSLEKGNLTFPPNLCFNLLCVLEEIHLTLTESFSF